MNLIFFTKKLNPRIKYIVNHLFSRVLGYSLEFTNDYKHFAASEKIRVQYGGSRLSDTISFFIPIHHFILENDIHPQDIAVSSSNQFPTLFEITDTEADLSFDFLSMAFYLISRYEEYLPFEADNHGRFTAKQSLAFKFDFLGQPIVDQWLMFINDQLIDRFQIVQLKSQNYTFIPTIDVDFAWAYRYKNLWRTLGGGLKDLLKGRFGDLSTRLAVLIKNQPDPYFKFDFLNRLHQANNCQAIYFLLFGAHGPFDKNTAPTHPAMHQLVKGITEASRIGIHPSYASNTAIHQLEKEINDLATVSEQTINKSRQHFLKLSFPETYQRLLSLGIREDYTMGYAEALGFRASTCYPFSWYDLENEVETKLMVFPFQIMDVTLKNYLSLTSEEAVKSCLQIIKEVRTVNGTLISIWHNSSFSSLMGWEGWQTVYESFLISASEKETHLL